MESADGQEAFDVMYFNVSTLEEGGREGTLIGRKVAFPPFKAPWPASTRQRSHLETWRWTVELSVERAEDCPAVVLEYRNGETDEWCVHHRDEWRELHIEHWRALTQVLNHETVKAYFAETELMHGAEEEEVG